VPLSLYLHIPFCSTRCSYCDFNTYAGLEDRIPAYVEALALELRRVAAALRDADTQGDGLSTHTVFFGGGTPSLLPVESIRRLLATIGEMFDLTPDAETSLEANPGTVSPAYLAELRDAGVNRLSLGAQSAALPELALLGRNHSFDDVAEAVGHARAAGFQNVSLDLIFGLPDQTVESWQDTMEKALALGTEHLSLYALSLEFGTPLRSWVTRGLVPAPDPDLAADMYEAAVRRLKESGYIQYEISNWALPRPDSEGGVESTTYACRHNLQYWRNLPYLGLGAGAHGCALGWRYANVRSPEAYIRAVTSEHRSDFAIAPAAVTKERVLGRTEMGETMLLGLRLTEEGVPEGGFARRFGIGLAAAYGAELRRFQDVGLVEWDTVGVRLTPRGRLVGNLVFEAFV